MTPEQRRTVYGHLNDAAPSLKAAARAAVEGEPMTDRRYILEGLYHRTQRMIATLQKEMDDGS